MSKELIPESVRQLIMAAFGKAISDSEISVERKAPDFTSFAVTIGKQTLSTLSQEEYQRGLELLGGGI